MTISVTTSVTQYTGTGADTALATVFEFDANSDIRVTQRVTATGVDTVLTEGTHYSVSGGSGSTGTVTVINGATNFTTAMTWTLERVTPLTQATDYVANDSFPAESHEDALDKLTRQSQDRDARTLRSLRFPVADAASLTSELPDAVARASKALTFDSSGNAVVTTPADASGTTVTATGSTTGRTLAERFAEIVNVRDFGAKGDAATNDRDAIQAAVDYVETLGGGFVFFPAGTYHIATQVVINKGVRLVGAGTAADTANANQTGVSATRIVFTGANDVTMFRAISATSGNRLWDVGFEDIMLSGSDTATGKAGIGIQLVDCEEPILKNIVCERMRTGGIHWSASQVVSAGMFLNGYRYTWGTNTGNTEAGSHGLIIGDHGASTLGCTQAHIQNCVSLVYNGSGIRFRGNVDNCQGFHIRTSVQSGGSGYGVFFEDNTGAGSDPRRNTLFYVTGPVHSEASCTGNRIIHHIEEGGAGSGGADAITVDAGGQIHYDTIDYQHNDVFATHRYTMSDEVHVPAGLMLPSTTSGATQDLFSSFTEAWAFVASGTKTISFVLPPNYGWSNGTIKEIRILYGTETAGDAGNTVVFRVQANLAAVNAATSATTHSSQQTTPALPATPQNKWLSESFDTSADLAFTRGDLLSVEIARLPVDPGDNATGDIFVLGAQVVFESSGPDSSPTKVFKVTAPYTT